MTKERLEEIRKRKYAEDRIVYTVFDNDEEATALHIVYDNELFVAYMMLKRVYETKEEAEWYCKMNAERTERFEPPMWEDLLEKDLYVFTFVKDRDVYEFICNIYLDKVDIRLERGLTGYGVEPIINCEFDNATKENYEKACEIVRNLFKGESNGKNA